MRQSSTKMRKLWRKKPMTDLCLRHYLQRKDRTVRHADVDREDEARFVIDNLKTM
jgi:hypothetical protein